MGEQGRNIDAEPDADEEEGQEQAPEGAHLGLDLVAEGRARYGEAGKEGAQCQRQADDGGRAGSCQDQQQGEGREGLGIARGGKRAEDGIDQVFAGQKRSAKGDEGLHDRQAERGVEGDAGPLQHEIGNEAGKPLRADVGLAEGTGEDHQEDGHDVLEDQHMRCGPTDRAGILLALGQDTGDHSGRRQAEAEADGNRDGPVDADHGKGGGADKAGEEEMRRREAQQVGAALVQFAQGDVHADVEQEEDNAEFGQEVGGAADLDQAKGARADQDSDDQVTDNRAEAHGLGRKRS